MPPPLSPLWPVFIAAMFFTLYVDMETYYADTRVLDVWAWLLHVRPCPCASPLADG